jgi:hypothetical protein
MMRWQADTGEPASMIGGWFIGPDRTGQARAYGDGPVARVVGSLDALLDAPSTARAPSAALMRADLASWRPAAVVAVTSPSSRLGHFLTGLLGPPTFRIGSVLAWRR